MVMPRAYGKYDEETTQMRVPKSQKTRVRQFLQLYPADAPVSDLLSRLQQMEAELKTKIKAVDAALKNLK